MGETKLKCEVIMLPAPDNADLSNFTVFYNSERKMFSYAYTVGGARDLTESGYVAQHLYLVSNRVIESPFPCMTVEMLVTGTKAVWQVDNEHDIDTDNQQRIEATSNHYMSEHAKVPLIPDSFLEQYVESEGKINEVFIEWETGGGFVPNSRGEWSKFMGNPVGAKHSDNAVIILPVKNSWSKDELRVKCKRAFVYGHDLSKDKPYPLYEDEFTKWFDKNIANE